MAICLDIQKDNNRYRRNGGGNILMSNKICIYNSSTNGNSNEHPSHPFHNGTTKNSNRNNNNRTAIAATITLMVVMIQITIAIILVLVIVVFRSNRNKSNRRDKSTLSNLSTILVEQHK